MATPSIQTAFASGEIAPSFYGRIDIDRNRVAATTCRNAFVGIRGGAYSRAGTKFASFSKQTGRQFPPRLLTFQFSINEGLALEFGNFYMRVFFMGAPVTETPIGISGISQADPAVVTFGAQGASAATPIDTGVIFSYAPGDLISLAGGTTSNEAVLEVTNSKLVSILPDDPGTGYAVNDTVTLAGGTSSVSAVVKVATLIGVDAKGSIAFAVNPSDGDTITLNGVTWTFKTTVSASAETAIFPTLAQTLAQLVADLTASANAGLTVASYSADPSNLYIVYNTAGAGGNAYTLAASVATPSAGTLSGGSTTGIGSVTIMTAGVFTALPAGGNMTESATSGGGSGASFQTSVFGPNAVTINSPGSYSVVPANPVSQDTTTGIGVGATFNVTWVAVAAFSNGDWLFIQGVQGMTELNGNTYIASAAAVGHVALVDVYGNQIDSTGFPTYTGGGTVSRIYTVPTIYSEQDLKYLKITQSADEMTICCVNQETAVEYPPQDLTRVSDTDWVFSPSVSDVSPAAPTALFGAITQTGNNFYAYVVTAVQASDGAESMASGPSIPSGGVLGSIVSSSTPFGPTVSTLVQANLSWPAVYGADEYNVYKATPSFGSPVSTGALFGYIGSAYGTAFVDNNIAPDLGQVPPLHQNPFARGQLVTAVPITGGTAYTNASVSVNTSTGSGALILPVVSNGAVVAYVVENAGHDYGPNDTITINGDGSGATAQLVIGAQTGTYPSVPGYFQERRVFANTLNETDTYYMSQPGLFHNFDARLPPIASDALIGSPWSLQVDGVQWLIQTSGGLLVLTGTSGWLLAGAGSFATNVQPISPSTQDNVPQAFSGVSPTVMPIKINYDVLYVNSKGSKYFDLPYQLYALSEPLDLTEISAHLFTGFTVLENAYCDEPDKLLWAVRNDGVMLSLTFYKSQQVASWTRHDTNGLFVSVCSVTEPPVTALYVATERFIGGHDAYMIERMDNRIWNAIEDCWCVDCGLSLPQPTPSATLVADSTYGTGSLAGVTGLVGGEGYSASTYVQVDDDANPPTGSGAVGTLTIVGGVITGVTFGAGQQGSGYTMPRLTFVDPANSGSGAKASAVLDTTATFTATNAVFDLGDVGSVIRMGGGVGVITSFIDDAHVEAFLSEPITALLPNSNGQVQPQPAGAWTMTAPVATISGLEYLAGATVTGLADGNVISPRVVRSDGSITLDEPASAVVVGLGFQAQLQSVYLEVGQPLQQGQRKKVAAANVLIEASRDVKIGGNQLDGSTVRPLIVAPVWNDMQPVENLAKPAYNSKVAPLWTGYQRQIISSGWAKPGQVALQQDNPLPMQILSIVSEPWYGDTPQQMAQPPQQRGQQ